MARPISKDRMVQAIRTFEEKQQRSNISWLEDQVRTCGEANGIHKVLEERRNKLAKGVKYESWASLVRQHNLTSMKDLLSIDVGQSDKGTRPSLSPEQQHAFLKELHRAINEDYDHDAPGYQPVQLPEDYGLLLGITDGLHDTDLRGSGVCGVDGIQDSDAVKMTGNYDVERLPWGKFSPNYGWELSTGFCLGLGNPSNQQWLAYYYCSRTQGPKVGPEGIQDHEREWRWRIFYKEPERFQHSFLNPMIFNDLIEWLEFYQKWWDRESKDYREWTARMIQEVKLLYPSDDEEEDDPPEKICYESPTIKDLFEYPTGDGTATPMEWSSISTALEAYRRKMTASHRALFSGRIRYLENDKSLTERQRLDRIAPYFRGQRWYRTGHGSSVTSPSQLLIPPGQEGYVELGINNDGTLPPAAAKRREEFLHDLQRLIGQSFQGLELPQEYIELLTLTDAISDPDFMYSRRAGMDGVCGGLPSTLQLAHPLSRWEDRGWTVLGGWQCGADDMSETQLLFCHKAESDVPEERDLRWRVHHSDRKDLDGKFYASISHWLDWRAGWFERLPAGWKTVSPPLSPEDVDYGARDDEEEEEEMENIE
jgi:hypothetical protein